MAWSLPTSESCGNFYSIFYYVNYSMTSSIFEMNKIVFRRQTQKLFLLTKLFWMISVPAIRVRGRGMAHLDLNSSNCLIFSRKLLGSGAEAGDRCAGMSGHFHFIHLMINCETCTVCSMLYSTSFKSWIHGFLWRWTEGQQRWGRSCKPAFHILHNINYLLQCSIWEN